MEQNIQIYNLRKLQYHTFSLQQQNNLIIVSIYGHTNQIICLTENRENIICLVIVFKSITDVLSVFCLCTIIAIKLERVDWVRGTESGMSWFKAAVTDVEFYCNERHRTVVELCKLNQECRCIYMSFYKLIKGSTYRHSATCYIINKYTWKTLLTVSIY